MCGLTFVVDRRQWLHVINFNRLTVSSRFVSIPNPSRVESKNSTSRVEPGSKLQPEARLDGQTTSIQIWQSLEKIFPEGIGGDITQLEGLPSLKLYP